DAEARRSRELPRIPRSATRIGASEVDLLPRRLCRAKPARRDDAARQAPWPIPRLQRHSRPMHLSPGVSAAAPPAGEKERGVGGYADANEEAGAADSGEELNCLGNTVPLRVSLTSSCCPLAAHRPCPAKKTPSCKPRT